MCGLDQPLSSAKETSTLGFPVFPSFDRTARTTVVVLVVRASAGRRSTAQHIMSPRISWLFSLLWRPLSILACDAFTNPTLPDLSTTFTLGQKVDIHWDVDSIDFVKLVLSHWGSNTISILAGMLSTKQPRLLRHADLCVKRTKPTTAPISGPSARTTTSRKKSSPLRRTLS